MTEDPAKIKALAQTIVDYELPEGYRAEGATVFLGTSAIFIVPKDGHGLAIIIMKFAAEGNDETMTHQQTEEMFAQQRGSSDIPMEIVSEEEGVINGKPVTLKRMAGVDKEGQKVLQVLTAFSVKERPGSGLVMIRALESEWDEAAYQQFITSME